MKYRIHAKNFTDIPHFNYFIDIGKSWAVFFRLPTADGRYSKSVLLLPPPRPVVFVGGGGGDEVVFGGDRLEFPPPPLPNETLAKKVPSQPIPLIPRQCR